MPRLIRGKISVIRVLPEERYSGSPWLPLGGLLLNCIMTSASIYALILVDASGHTDGISPTTMCWLGIGFFGFGICVNLVLLARPHSLLLDSEGFTLAGGLIRTPQKIAWRDIERFFVHRLDSPSPSFVGYDFAAGHEPKHWLLKISRANGADGMLPGLWTLPAPDLVERLNAYRARAMAYASDRDGL
ncbi:hypothetical protein C5688_08650 [Methylocystis sp. MitZ-2018]|nr:hypothetical protein C5688_08650 [Methylocystis sp. MitZ-2018]